MIQNDGFTDLRMSHAHGSSNEDSVWPSFTDIMTVIVMIFLMALVIILIRNVDLVEKLRQTMISEQQVAELARTKEAQRIQLENTLSQTRENLSQTESNLAQASADLKSTSAALETTTGELETTTEKLAVTSTNLETTSRERNRLQGETVRLNEKVSAMLGEIAALENLRDRLAEDNIQSKDTNTRLSQQLGNASRRNTLLVSEKETLNQSLDELEQAYASLETLRARLAVELTDAMTNIATLQSEKTTALSDNSQLQARLDTLNEILEELEAGRTNLKQENTQLSGRVGNLQAQMEEMARRYLALQQSRASVERERDGLAEQLGDAETRYSLSVRQLAILKNDLEQREKELASERQQLLSTEEQIVALKGDYVNLEEKYNKLVRPARSSAGREVVEIRFTKSNGINIYQVRSSGNTEYQNVSRQQLTERMDQLKAKHPNNLYVRIIIPDDSGLSYNEAWRFTNEMHTGYDYYFQ